MQTSKKRATRERPPKKRAPATTAGSANLDET